MATTIIYECRDCDQRVEEPLSNYVDHPNKWVYTDFRCDSCSEIARAEFETHSRAALSATATAAQGPTSDQGSEGSEGGRPGVQIR